MEHVSLHRSKREERIKVEGDRVNREGRVLLVVLTLFHSHHDFFSYSPALLSTSRKERLNVAARIYLLLQFLPFLLG